MADNWQTIAERLRGYRLAAGLSQEKVAQAVGRTAGMVSKIERGERKLHIDEVSLWADVFQVPVHALVGGGDQDLYQRGYADGYQACRGAVRKALGL